MKQIVFSIFILFSFSVMSQESSKFAAPKFQNLNFEDGLSNLTVYSFEQDNHGYIWIATSRGLNRYDGISFEHYLFKEDENSLYHDLVLKLYKNYEGNIFCGTGSGVNLFDADEDKIFRIKSNNEYYLDFIDFEDKTYGSSSTGGLSEYNTEEKSFVRLSVFPDDIVFNNLIQVDESGIWGKTTDNKYLINFNPKTNVLQKLPIPNNNFRLYNGNATIKIDNLLLIAGRNFSVFDLSISSFIPLPEKWNKLKQLVDLEIAFISRVDDNILWIGTKEQGLFIYNFNTNSIANLNKANSDLQTNTFTSAFKDKNDNMWLGTFDQGVDVSFKQRNNFNFDISLHNLTSGKFITSIVTDNNNNYYIGTHFDGLYIYNSQTHKSRHLHTGNSSLNDNHIRTLMLDSQNRLWIGTIDGLQIFNIVSQKMVEIDLPKPINGIVCFCEHGDNIIAGSDMQGFFIFDRESNILKQELNLGFNITKIISLNNEELVLSSYGLGLFIYNINSGSFRNLQKNIPTGTHKLNDIITMHLDSDSVLWVGNFKYGLYKFDLRNNQFTGYNIKDGLPNNDIVGIVEDNSGMLWLSTSYGLSRFDKKNEFINYFSNEGLKNIQFHQKATLIDSQGTIFLGGNYGLTFFNPQDLISSDKNVTPNIILESLNVLNKIVEANDETKILTQILNNTPEITLNHKQKIFNIEYHAFDYIAANKIRYSYILKGFDNDWNRVGERTNASYSNLRPGTYLFKVKAQNNKGIWSETLELKIKIKPSPFNTIFAYFIYLLLLVTITYISLKLIINAKLYKSRLEVEHNERLRENEISQMKMRFFNNISHEIRTPLTLIKWNVDLFTDDITFKNKKPDSLIGLRYSTERLLNLVNQLLSVKKLENDALDLKVENNNIVQITNELIKPFVYVASSRQISIDIESDFDKLFLPIDVDKYEKIMSNLLSNSLKFAKQGGFIKIKIDTPNNIKEYYPGSKLPGNSFVKISVIDNGRGIPQKELSIIFNRFAQSEVNKDRPDYSGTGIGLNFTKRLVELHHGGIIAASTENVETTFSFILSRNDKTYKNDIWVNSKQTIRNQVLIENDIVINDEPENRQEVILIIEDDLELNRVITTHFKKQYKVISCYDGKEGLKLVQNQLPDIIVSDIMMPEMDGFTLCNLIREDELISHIPIVLLTSKIDAESKIEGYSCGADDYISKPFDLNILRVRVNNLIENRKRLQSFYKKGILDEHEIKITNRYELNFIKRVESVISENYKSTDLNVIFLSGKMNMSRTSLYRKFMSAMDISPKDFITKYRIKKSIELMENGNNNFGEISYLCGFGSQSNFSVLFKKEKGITPLQFKKTL